MKDEEKEFIPRVEQQLNTVKQSNNDTKTKMSYAFTLVVGDNESDVDGSDDNVNDNGDTDITIITDEDTFV
jgi:hypothetical protein